MRSIALSCVLLVGACAQPTVPSSAGPSGAAASCSIVESSDWAAWVNAMPGPNARPTLIVTGKVTVPTGGYGFSWGDPIVMESYPVQIVVDLRPLRPGGLATQALVTHDVRGEWPSEARVGS